MRILLVCLALLWGQNLFAGKQEIDAETGMKIDVGFEETKQNCVICHSASFIINGRGNREEWKETIIWMQKTQNLWELDPKTEDLVLTYLAKNYPQTITSSRRPLLSADKLPK